MFAPQSALDIGVMPPKSLVALHFGLSTHFPDQPQKEGDTAAAPTSSTVRPLSVLFRTLPLVLQMTVVSNVPPGERN